MRTHSIADLLVESRQFEAAIEKYGYQSLSQLGSGDERRCLVKLLMDRNLCWLVTNLAAPVVDGLSAGCSLRCAGRRR